MQILSKIQKHGLKDSLGIALKKLCYMVSDALYIVFRKLPIDQNLIVFESEGDCSDNAYALFCYIESHQDLRSLRVVWLVSHPENFQNSNGVWYVPKTGEHINIRRCKALATCKWFIYDHNNVLEKHNSREGQTYVFLTHGCTFKAATAQADFISNADEVFVTGSLFHKPISEWSHCRIERVKSLGYPRLDYFFEPLNNKQVAFQDKYHFKEYKKVALWMPTFRRSINMELDENYFHSETGLPIINTLSDLRNFNDFLYEHQILCIVKVHHLQAKSDAFKTKLSNILILLDELILENDLQLYQMIMLSDLLITDYSSIGNDYVLLDRPIIYTLDDFEEYSKSRGFSIPNLKEYLPGYHVYNFEDLKQAFIEIVDDNMDRYKPERNRVLPAMHEFRDGQASKRISEYLDILK